MVNRKTSTIVVATLAMLAVVGCSPTPTTPPTPTAVVTTPTPSPTPSQTDEQADAVRTVMKFYEVLNQVATNYEVPLDAFHEVAGGDLLADRLKTYQGERVAGVRQEGDVTATVRSVTDVADGSFEVEVCLDSSDADIVDGEGRSISAPGGPTMSLHKFTVERIPTGALRATQDELLGFAC